MTNATECISVLEHKIWKLKLKELKNIERLQAFKTKIKNWGPETFVFRTCKVYTSLIVSFEKEKCLDHPFLHIVLLNFI